MRKTTQLKKLLQSNRLEFILEAHDGLSAKIVEEASFKGIWASGLSISAAMGVRDSNEASWTQVMEVVEFMSDNTTIPILLDGDTGFGNFNNMRRLVKKLEQRNVAGVCIEDKLFPKTNSFIGGENQPLADIREFCGKIKAGKDTQTDPDFCVVARIEAFIAGWGLEEAMKRATAYYEAGADAILVHSKISTPDHILSFMKHWKEKCPVVIVPTMYCKTPTETFEKAGVSLVIWANHTLRSSIASMQDMAKRICEEKSVANIEREIVPVKEIFRLQNVAELKEAERRYLPEVEVVKGIILAASKGKNFGDLTDKKPKCMLEVFGKSILSTLVQTMNSFNIKDITVVTGYKSKAVNLPNINKVLNKDYDRTGILYSLSLVSDKLDGETVISFGDILFEEYILQGILEDNADIVLAVDTSWWQGKKKTRVIDAVIGGQVPSDSYLSKRGVRLKEIGSNIDHNKAHGEWIGLVKVSSRGAEIIKRESKAYERTHEESFKTASMVNFINYLLSKKIEVKIFYFRGHWLDIDSLEDLSYGYKQGL